MILRKAAKVKTLLSVNCSSLCSPCVRQKHVSVDQQLRLRDIHGIAWSSRSPLLVEPRAANILFGDRDYRSYINTVLPFNYMWEIKLIDKEQSEKKLIPVIRDSLC